MHNWHPVYIFVFSVYVFVFSAARIFSISYESPKSILSLVTIDFLGTRLFKRERKRAETWRGKERRKKGERMKGAKGRNWISLMAALDKFWLSQSRPWNRNKVGRVKSRDRHQSYRLILPGPLSRSVDSSMNERCSFTMPFSRIFSLRSLYSDSLPDFSISSSRIEKFSFLI